MDYFHLTILPMITSDGMLLGQKTSQEGDLNNSVGSLYENQEESGKQYLR